MKSAWSKILVITFMVGAFHAFAAMIPGWDKPILQSTLEEQDQTGHEIQVAIDQTLTMNRQEGSAHPTSFTFFEKRRLHCLRTNCAPIPETTVFLVKDIRSESCGSTVYYAEEMLPSDLNGNVARSPRTLHVIDHTERLCEDYKKFAWEASIVTAPGQDGYVRLFFGNPETVSTVQSNPFIHNY